MSARCVIAAALLLGVAVRAPNARADGVEAYGFLAADGWFAPELGGHGILMVALRMPRLIDQAELSLIFNTDTLRARLDNLCIDPALCFAVQLEGEYKVAGLLIDYYRDDRKIPSLGFGASYFAASGEVKTHLGGREYFEYSLVARRWFFDRLDATAPDFVLPPSDWVLEHRLRAIAWHIAPDAADRDLHRPERRVRGAGLVVEVGADQRRQASAWGGADDPRNRAAAETIVFLRAWGAVGFEIFERSRVQLSGWAGWGRKEDDITRARIGGLNPYVVPLAGRAWASFLASKFGALQLSAHVRVADDVEVGPMLDFAAIEDLHRTGADDFGRTVAAGAFLDMRMGELQLDVKAGWSPDVGGISAYALLGFAIEKI